MEDTHNYRTQRGMSVEPEVNYFLQISRAITQLLGAAAGEGTVQGDPRKNNTN